MLGTLQKAQWPVSRYFDDLRQLFCGAFEENNAIPKTEWQGQDSGYRALQWQVLTMATPGPIASFLSASFRGGVMVPFFPLHSDSQLPALPPRPHFH